MIRVKKEAVDFSTTSKRRARLITDIINKDLFNITRLTLYTRDENGIFKPVDDIIDNETKDECKEDVLHLIIINDYYNMVKLDDMGSTWCFAPDIGDDIRRMYYETVVGAELADKVYAQIAEGYGDEY